MSRSALGASAIQLLLTALELPTPRLSAGACRRYRAEAARLKCSGLLKSAGYEPAITAEDDHDDTSVSLTWSQDQETYGYFSQTRGWVEVAADKIEILDVDTTALVAALVANLGLPMKPMVSLLPEYLWELGSAYLGRSKRTPILLARRLHEEHIWRQVESALRKRPALQRRILLTSTPSQVLPPAPRNCEIVSLVDLLAGQDDLALDPDVLRLRLDGAPVIVDGEPLVIIGGGREVRFFGAVYRFPKGDKQRRVIMLLHDRYREGEKWVSSAEIAEELELGGQTRLRDLFKGNIAWRRLLKEKNGMCGFCWPATAS
jgi:hypothetical protein